MVDYLKIWLPKTYQSRLLNNPRLSFCYDLNPETGEVRTENRSGKRCTPKRVAYFQNMTFKIYDTGSITIDGSLHKYWNKGEHNFNDFALYDFKTTIDEFLNNFDIDAKEAKITILEIGLNIHVQYPIERILDNLFIHRGRHFKWTKTNTEGHYIECEHDHFRIKIYNKSKQYKKDYGITQNILRIEINYKGVKLRRDFGIVTIYDLQHQSFDCFCNAIKRELELILFYDWTIQHSSVRLANYANHNYWKEYLDNGQTSTFNKHRNILRAYTNDYSEQVFNKLIDQFTKKFDLLSQGGTRINDLVIGGNHIPPEAKICIVTGLGISMQKKKSTFLSNTGIKFYKSHNHIVYKDLERRFLSNKWIQASDQKKISEISHNIRNAYYNRLYRIDPNQLTLFFG